MTRKPFVAGQFYPGDSERLLSEIKASFLSDFGPGELPKKRSSKIKAVISPHAGYIYSGACAAWAFKVVGESEFPDVYIMLGLSHRGYPSSVSAKDWETPLGTVKTDKDFAELISKECSIPIYEQAHQMEHSIEVQIPFLQFVSKDRIEDLRILPIIISDDIDPAELGNRIKKSIEKSGKKVVIICSSDFTHYGEHFGYLPFSDDVKNRMHKLDNDAINFILKGKSKEFSEYLEKTGATICGRNPIISLLNMINFKNSKLLKYYTSGDISKDYSSAVGYASIKFE